MPLADRGQSIRVSVNFDIFLLSQPKFLRTSWLTCMCIQTNLTENRMTSSEHDQYCRELLNDFFKGNMDALGTLWQKCLRSKLYGVAMTWVKNPHDAEDIVQTVLEKIMTNPHKIRKRELSSFEAFVVTTTKNACRDLLRKQKPSEPINEISSIGNPTARTMRRIGITAEIEAFKTTLSHEDRQIFIGKVIKNFPFQQIADQLEKPMRTVHYRYQRILKQLDQHTALRGYWEEMVREGLV